MPLRPTNETVSPPFVASWMVLRLSAVAPGRLLRNVQGVDIGAAAGSLGHYIEGDLLGQRTELVFTDGDDPLGAKYFLYLPDSWHISIYCML